MPPHLLALVLMAPQPDTLLVHVLHVDAQTQVVVEAVLRDDSTLHLPSRPVGELLGVTGSTGATVTTGSDTPGTRALPGRHRNGHDSRGC
jgi:hypothetical protein